MPMTHRQDPIWAERSLLGALLLSLGMTLCIVISVHHRASRPVELPSAQPTQIAVATGPVANAVSAVKPIAAKVAIASKPATESPPPASKVALPPPEDPTKKAITSLTTVMATELAAAGEADRRAAALDKARVAAEADTKRWKRREFLVKQQIATLAQQADTLEARDAQIASERDVLAQERDALKAALTNAKRQGSFAVLPYKGPNGTWRRPIVIECADNTVKLRPDGPKFSMTDLSPFLNPRSNPLVLAVARQLLHIEGSQTPDGAPAVPYLVFLVRPSGIRTYYEARERLEPLGIAFGYELIDQNLVVDVPDFDNLATWDGSAPVELPLVPAPDASPGLSLPASGNGLARNGQGNASGTRGAAGSQSQSAGGDLAMGPAAGSVADFVWPSASRGAGNGKVNLPTTNAGSPTRGGMGGSPGGVGATDGGPSTAITDGKTAATDGEQGTGLTDGKPGLGNGSTAGSALSRSTSAWLAARPPNTGQGTATAPGSSGSGTTASSLVPGTAGGRLLASAASGSRRLRGSGSPVGSGSPLNAASGDNTSATDGLTANPSESNAGAPANVPSTQPKAAEPGSPDATPGELPELEPATDSPDPATVPFRPSVVGSREPRRRSGDSAGRPSSGASTERTANAAALASPPGESGSVDPSGNSGPVTGGLAGTTGVSPPSASQLNQVDSATKLSEDLAPAASVDAVTTAPSGDSTAQNQATPSSTEAGSTTASSVPPSLLGFKPTAATPALTSAASEDIPFRSTPPSASSPPSDTLSSLFSSKNDTDTASGSQSSSSSSPPSSNSSTTQTSGSSADPSPPSGIGLPSVSLNQSEESSDTKSPFNIAPPPIVPKPTGAIDVQFQIVVVCRQNDILLHPGGYTLSSQALKEQGGGPDSLLARELRAILRRRANIDPMIRPKPSIKYLVETNGSDTFWTARKLLMFSGLDWPTSLEVAGTQERSMLTGDAR